MEVWKEGLAMERVVGGMGGYAQQFIVGMLAVTPLGTFSCSSWDEISVVAGVVGAHDF